MLINLLHNITLLIALSTFYGLFLQKLKGQENTFRITIGVWFGLVTIAGMLMPFNYAEGIFFDGRSVILALSGLFGGWIPALISAAIAGSFRIMAGGAGAYVGLSTIILCSLTGVLFRHYFKNKAYKLKLVQLLFIGFVAHMAMLGSQLLFPWPIGLEIIAQIWLPVVLIFPLTFMIIGALLGREEKRIISNKKLSFSEKRYRTTLYSIGDAVITTDKIGKITLMNAIAEQLTGYTEKEALGEPLEKVFVIINEHSRKKVESPVEKVLQSGGIVGLANHTLLVAKNGDEIPIADSGAPIEDAAGQIVGVVLVFRDQIEEHLHQSLLKASETKYRELIETTDAIAWEYDIINDAYVYVAPQIGDKTGWQPDEWTNLGFWQQNIHPHDRESACNHRDACSPVSPRHTLEYRFRKKDGEYLWVRDLITVETSDNNQVKLRGIMLDISTLKKTEEDLKLSEEKFRRLFERHSAVHFLLDPTTGQIENVNQAAADFYGWTIEELKQMNIHDINTMEKQALAETLKNASKTRNNYFEVKHRLANGQVRDVEIYSSIIEIMGKAYLHAIVHDITEKKCNYSGRFLRHRISCP